jgi:hypothetical protein
VDGPVALETISISGGNQTQVAAARARKNSATRAERSWNAVGKSLRNEMRKHPKPREKPS